MATKSDAEAPGGPGERDGGPLGPVSAAPIDLRDWFAGQALAGLTSIAETRIVENVANEAYFLADAMLAERERKRESDED